MAAQCRPPRRPGRPAPPARPRSGRPGPRARPACRCCPRTTSATARRCSSRRLRRDARPGVVLGVSPRCDQPGDPGLGVGLHDQHEVVGGGLAGLHQQRHVVDDDGVRRRCRAPSSVARAPHQRMDDRVEPCGGRRGRRRRRRPARAGPAHRRRSARRRRTRRRRPPAPGCRARPPPGRCGRRRRPRPRVRPAAAETVLFPEPIPPVSPIRSTHGQ